MISIIIPVYNAEPYLEQCFNSISSQTLSDWECILVDDGSTDGSGKICDSWANKDNRIKIIHQKNQGVSAARNSGLNTAKGEWIAFVDSDDWLEPDYLSAMLEQKGVTDLVVSGQIREYEDGHTIIYRPKALDIFYISKDYAEEFNNLNVNSLLYAPHEKLFRADIIKINNLTFQVGCSYGEDLQFVYSYLEHVKTVGTVNRALYHYRMANSGTLSTIFRENQFQEDYRQWQIVYNFYNKHGLLNEASCQYLAKRLWGIVYDGIFLYSKLKRRTLDYINKIMNIPEHDFLCKYSFVFPCSYWIKWVYKNRSSCIFYAYFGLRGF